MNNDATLAPRDHQLLTTTCIFLYIQVAHLFVITNASFISSQREDCSRNYPVKNRNIIISI